MTAGYLSAMAGFGLVGFDPTIALVAAASLLLGRPSRQVAAFLISAIVATPVLGTVLALTVGRALADVDWRHLLRTGWWPAAVEAALAVAALGWVAWRVRRGVRADAHADRSTGGGLWAAVGLGLLLAGAWVADPGFVAGVVAAGRTGSVAAVVAGQLIWVAIAQCLSFVVLIALAVVEPERLARRFESVWQRTAAWRYRLFTAAVALLALALALDALWYAGAGHYAFGR